MGPLYFESHITIEPVFDDNLQRFAKICGAYGFRVADLLMKKRTDQTPERSEFDSFCTGRSDKLDDLKTRMTNLVSDLKTQGFTVWRYKIENVIFDSKIAEII